jgi:sarcosine oxidase
MNTDSWEVVVVGLGAMGSAALYQASRRGARVLGIDRFRPPHDRGSSHGDTRITRQAIGEGRHYVPLALRSRDIWRELETLTGEQLYAGTGVLIFGREGQARSDHGTADFLAETRRAARDFNIEHESLDHGALSRRFPQFRYAGDEIGYYEPGGGYLRPEKCIAAQLACARRNGAELQPGLRVTSLEAEPGGESVTLHCEDGQAIRAARVIIATGAWISQLLPPAVSARLRVCRQVLHWFPLRENHAAYAPRNCPAFIRLSDSEQDMIYGFPAVDGPAGGIKVAGEQLTQRCDPDRLDRQVSDAECEAFWRQAAQFLPLAPTPLKQAVCLYTLTGDFDFIIDRHPLHRQVVFASACSGHGFKHSPAVGEILVELALDGRATLDISPFGLNRFQF